MEKDENNKLKLDSKTLLGYIGGAEEISTNLMKLEEALDPAVKTLFPDKLRLDTNFEDSLKILLNTFGNNLIKELVTDKSDGGWSLLEALGKEPENKFWDFIQKSLKQVDSATCEGQGEKIVNAIGGVASLKVPFVDVVATFIKNRDKNHVEELLKAKKEKGWNFLHFVSRHNEEIRILDLLQLILDKLDRPLVLDLLQEKTEDGWTFLHIMCESTAKDLLISVLDWIENNFGPNNIKNLLTNKSKINSTCLMILSERNEKTSVLDFFKCLTEHLDKDVLRNFMLEQNNNEDSFLTVINEKSNGNSMMELLECINEYLGKELTVKLISLKNNVDRNILLHLENFKDKSLIESLKKFVLS